MARTYRTLTESDVNHFIEKGHIVLQDCFPRELAEEWRAFAFKRLGYDPDDPGTWEQPRIHLPSMNRVPIQEIAPRASDAIYDLVGGEDRVINLWDNSKPTWGDGFIINFALGADTPWQPPSPEVSGWHKDGDFFRHFLDSPEQGLLTIVVWSDIYPKSGGTFVACDSVQHVAQRLYEHPEGLSPEQWISGNSLESARTLQRLPEKRGMLCCCIRSFCMPPHRILPVAPVLLRIHPSVLQNR